MHPKHLKCVFLWSMLVSLVLIARTHEAKDFDDSILYKIDFDTTDLEKDPDRRNNTRSFYTHEREKYECLIPVVENAKEEKNPGDADISPLTLIRPLFSATTCSYRIEVYWSYEICHGFHIRQYHEEREGKSSRFQEYYLGKWNDEKTMELSRALEEQRKTGMKHKTTKIDGINYPYFEMEMTDGTLCDIIGEPRTTKIRYVCYPHGKNDIYSFKETSSCHYEAIILSPLFCIDSAFHPEESKEMVIKCFNADAVKPHKPLSMLRQELNELNMVEADLPFSKDAATVITSSAGNGERYVFVNKFGSDVGKIVEELMNGASLERTSTVENVPKAVLPEQSAILEPIKDLLTGSSCITGGTGWWKFELCHRVHVRQFHRNGKAEQEIFLGYFTETAHRRWIDLNPDKAFKQHQSTSIWYHYEGGSRCDRTGKARQVDVKFTCASTASSPSSLAMYLLEPKTCQYILVVESPYICDFMKIADKYGYVTSGNKFKEIKRIREEYSQSTMKIKANENESPAPRDSTEDSEEVDGQTGKFNPSEATGTVELQTTTDELN